MAGAKRSWLPPLSPVHWASIGMLVALLAALAGVGIAGWWRLGALGAQASRDRWSLPLLLTGLVLLYALVVVRRMAVEPQYGNFVWGRLQEALYLKSWHRARSYALPLVAVGSVAFAFWQQGGWTAPASALAWLVFLWAVMGFVDKVTGAWVRPVEKEDFLLLEPGAHAASQGGSPQDAALVPEPGWHALTTARGRRIHVPGADPSHSPWRLVAGFLINDEVNRALQDARSSLCTRALEIAPEPFKLSPEFEHYRETALIHERAKGGTLYNERKVRLRSDLDALLHNAAPVRLQRTSYYDSICTNELTRYLIGPRHAAPEARSDLYQHVRHAQSGRVIALSASGLSNHLGGGTLAITQDGFLLVSKQGRLALLSAGLYAPAGSGSFDWGDARGVATLSALVTQGLERELREECNFERAQIVRTILLGSGRDMSRGGKPDFMGVTLVAAEAQPRIRGAEAGFVDQHHPIRLAATDAATLKAELAAIRSREYWHASGALLVTMQLLIDAEPATHEAILQFLRQR